MGVPGMTNLWKLATQTRRGFSEDHGTQMAAAIAYHVLFSFIPLITVLLAVFGFIMRDPQRQQLAADRVLASLPLQSGTLVYDSIHNISTQTGALTLIGLLSLLWTASGLFGVIRGTLNIAWDAKAKRGFITGTLLDLGAVLGLGVLLIVSFAGTMAIHSLQTLSVNQSGALVTGSLQTLFTVLGVILPAASSYVVFLLLYRYVPNVRHSVGDVWPGALVATLLFELAKHGFVFYVSHFNKYQAVYGALGAVMLFMLWTYLSAIIMLIGAELASEYEHMRHGRSAEEDSSVLLQGDPQIVGR